MASLQNFKGLTHRSDQDPSLEGGCLKMIYRQNPVFYDHIFLCVFLLVENQALTPPHLSGKFHYFLAAKSSSRSDDVTLLSCLFVALFLVYAGP